jgi:predicted transcriptional regulator with HTH domain
MYTYPYIHYIIIYSKTYEDHPSQVKEVLHRLNKHYLRINPDNGLQC